jgi:hypothetical protein
MSETLRLRTRFGYGNSNHLDFPIYDPTIRCAPQTPEQCATYLIWCADRTHKPVLESPTNRAGDGNANIITPEYGISLQNST